MPATKNVVSNFTSRFRIILIKSGSYSAGVIFESTIQNLRQNSSVDSPISCLRRSSSSGHIQTIFAFSLTPIQPRYKLSPCSDSLAVARKRQARPLQRPHFRGKALWHNPCITLYVHRQSWVVAALVFALLKAQGGQDLPSEIPFESREGLLWLRVTLSQSKEPLNFLLDTGAGASVITRSTADRLKLKLGSTITVR